MEGSREEAQKEEGMTQSAVMCLLWASLSLQVKVTACLWPVGTWRICKHCLGIHVVWLYSHGWSHILNVIQFTKDLHTDIQNSPEAPVSLAHHHISIFCCSIRSEGTTNNRGTFLVLVWRPILHSDRRVTVMRSHAWKLQLFTLALQFDRAVVHLLSARIETIIFCQICGENVPIKTENMPDWVLEMTSLWSLSRGNPTESNLVLSGSYFSEYISIYISRSVLVHAWKLWWEWMMNECRWV